MIDEQQPPKLLTNEEYLDMHSLTFKRMNDSYTKFRRKMVR